MNINEYKKKKIRELNEFFKGIKFENIGIEDKKIILGLTPECSDFFNKEESYRNITEKFLNKINGYYIELVYTHIEYAKTPEEVDFEIKKFEDKLRYEITKYKDLLIKIAFRKNKEDEIIIEELPEVKEKNILKSGLNFIKIKIGDNVYSALKTNYEASKEELVVDNLTYILIYIYLIKNNIEDKKQKQEEFLDFVSENFSVRDKKEYSELFKFYEILTNEKDYETFLQSYSETMNKIKSMIQKRNQNKILSETNPKPKGK